mgnify:CR=1 FL=1|jgi:hypothetical protein|tara:strand:- start:242 stop:631 length:390 start_codon:yes stop_codon:yes gene_type:complete
MSQDKKQDSNVIGIGHNQSPNTYSQEQYSKLLNKLHEVLEYSQQQIAEVERFLDQAFTKYPFSNPNQPKLKDFEVHEARQRGKDTARQYRKDTNKDIAKVEAKAKENGIALDILVEREKERREEEELNK